MYPGILLEIQDGGKYLMSWDEPDDNEPLTSVTEAGGWNREGGEGEEKDERGRRRISTVEEWGNEMRELIETKESLEEQSRRIRSRPGKCANCEWLETENMTLE